MEETIESSYTIKTPSFEGPFALLLSLIEQRKFFINEISLAQVTEDFINYINKLDDLHPAEISNFVITAATLILIKSKSLLPNMQLSKEEETEIFDLEDRLKLFETFSHLSLNIKNVFGKKIIFAPLERKNDIQIFVPDNKINISIMHELAREVLEKIPKKVILPEVEVRKVVNIEQMIEKLTERIQSSLQFSFKDFAGGSFTKEEKVVVIVGFLAMLEMVKQGIVNVIQNDNFQDMMIEKQTLEINETVA